MNHKWFLPVVGVFLLTYCAFMLSPVWTVSPNDLSAWPFNLPLMLITLCAGVGAGVLTRARQLFLLGFFVALSFGLLSGWYGFGFLFSLYPNQRVGEAGMYPAFIMYLAHILIVQVAYLAGGLFALLTSRAR